MWAKIVCQTVASGVSWKEEKEQQADNNSTPYGLLHNMAGSYLVYKREFLS